MKIDEIRAFVAVAEAGGILPASKKINMPVASVARRLKDLEEQLDVVLVDRTTQNTSVSRWGKEIYPVAVSALEAIAKIGECVGRLKETPSGHLRIMAPSAFGRSVIAPLLPEFREQYPEIRVTLIFNNNNRDLNEAGADVAFRLGIDPVGSERFEPLGTVKYHLVASPDYLAKAAELFKPNDIADHPVVCVSTSGEPEHWEFENGEDEATVEVLPSVSVYDPSVACELVKQGAGVALISEVFCKQDLENGTLIEPMNEWLHVGRQQYDLVYARSASSLARVSVFLDFVREHVGFSNENGPPSLD